ncbi:MAG: DUF4358 domain-containing protein [Angelakisella sp.]|nr:DUF4358 domain-containing protein [Angelakisella sp.]
MMKRIVALVLCTMMAMTAVACGGGSGSSSSSSQAPAVPTLKEGVTLSSMIDSLSQEYEITMPAALDDQIMKDMMNIDPADVEEYAGYMSMVMTSADNLIGVKAKEGKLDTVKAGLESRLEFVRKSFEQYLPSEKEKSGAGKVFTVGDYAFLVIAGRMDKDPATEIAEIEEKIMENFNK